MPHLKDTVAGGSVLDIWGGGGIQDVLQAGAVSAQPVPHYHNYRGKKDVSGYS